MPRDLWWIGEVFDAVIIGGGVNGLAIAQQLGERSLRVVLLEKADIGSGASTKTSKLAHGGVRYLEQGDIPVVLKSIKARRYLLKNAPHLVKPQSFLYPVYESGSRSLWQVKLGLTLYNWLDIGGSLPAHENLSRDEVVRFFPELRMEGFCGCCRYFDARMDDIRLNASLLRGAKRAGVVVSTYTEATELVKQGSELVAVGFKSDLFGISGQVRTRLVINATGASSPLMLAADHSPHTYTVSPSKGSHLVIDRVSSEHALILHAPQDGRVFFAIPWNGETLIGTTETLLKEPIEDVCVTEEDRSYLLEAFTHYFPKWKGRVIAEFSGVRPLAAEPGKSLGSISRKAVIETSASGMISVIGGKYTTFSQVAREVADKAAAALRRRDLIKSQEMKIFGGDCQNLLALSPLELQRYSKHLFSEQIKRLIEVYGSAFTEILTLIEGDPSLSGQICPLHPHLAAELVHAITKEQVMSVEDWYYRRTAIGYTSCRGKVCFDKTKQIFDSVMNAHAFLLN